VESENMGQQESLEKTYSAPVNGTPGILVWSKETLLASITCEMTEEHITNLYEVVNPDKLAYMQRQMQPHR
jgi:hypothetical protein